MNIGGKNKTHRCNYYKRKTSYKVKSVAIGQKNGIEHNTETKVLYS